MRMIVINNLSWAIGLQWTAPRLKFLTYHERLIMARELQGQDQPEFTVISRRQKQLAFGISEGALDNWKNVRSLAAFLPDCSSFLGLFCFLDIQGEECWWLFARHDGANVGTGDQVFSSLAEAQKEINILSDLLRSRTHTAGGKTFAEQITCQTPEESIHWLTDKCSLGLVDELLGTGMLTPLIEQRRTKLSTLIAVTAATCAIIWGIHWYFNYRAEQQAIKEAQLQAAHKTLQRQQLLAKPEEHFVQEWQQSPMPDLSGAACTRAILALPIVTSGWTLHSAICSGKNLTVRWSHSAIADFLALPPSARLESPRLAISSTPIPERLKARASQTFRQLPSQGAAKRFLYQLCQSTSTRVQISFQAPKITKIDKVDIYAPWAEGRWEIAGIAFADILTGHIPTILAQLPGLTLDTIALQNDTWTFKGKVYATGK